jgi:hypothetical protein
MERSRQNARELGFEEVRENPVEPAFSLPVESCEGDRAESEVRVVHA